MVLTETDKTIKAFEAEIKRLLKAGKTPKQAVDEAYKLYPVMKIMQGEIEPQLIGEMKRGGAVGVAKPLLKKASTAVWAADGLTLSKRTTQGAKEVTKQAAAVIAEAVKKGQTIQKAALALFDGYGYGHTLPEQDIPDFLKRLTQIAKAKEYGGAEFHKTLRAVERNLKKLNVQGLKAAYTQVKNAVLSGNEKRIEKAVYTATQERTRYFARRIARTEMARAYNDGFVAKWANDEDCVAFKWKMSTAHPFCDICDMYAKADLYGMGPGIFPKDKVPMLPVHPNCMCHLRPVMVGSKLLKSETPKARIEEGGREWLAKQSLPNRQRILGIYGEKDVKAGRSWTEKARSYSGEKMKSRLKDGTIKEKDLEKELQSLGVNVDLSALKKPIRDANLAEVLQVINDNPKLAKHIEKHGLSLGTNLSGVANGATRFSMIPGSIEVKLSSKLLHDVTAVKMSVAAQEKSGFKMPAADKEALHYTASHEFGHVLEVVALYERTQGLPTWAVGDEFKRQAKLIRKEVIACAKEIDKKVNFRNYTKYLSEYGRKDEFEFFAECHANMRCGKPNVLGQALKKWLGRWNGDG